MRPFSLPENETSSIFRRKVDHCHRFNLVGQSPDPKKSANTENRSGRKFFNLKSVASESIDKNFRNRFRFDSAESSYNRCLTKTNLSSSTLCFDFLSKGQRPLEPKLLANGPKIYYMISKLICVSELCLIWQTFNF